VDADTEMLIVYVDEEFREGPEDDGLRELGFEQAEPL
jgi:hypothetical protein